MEFLCKLGEERQRRLIGSKKPTTCLFCFNINKTLQTPSAPQRDLYFCTPCFLSNQAKYQRNTQTSSSSHPTTKRAHLPLAKGRRCQSSHLGQAVWTDYSWDLSEKLLFKYSPELLCFEEQFGSNRKPRAARGALEQQSGQKKQSLAYYEGNF